MIDNLHVTKFEMLQFAEEMFQRKLGRQLRKDDLTLLKSTKGFMTTVDAYMKEWKQEVDLGEIDAWLSDGGYEEVFKKYTPLEADWLGEFQDFFTEAWDVVPEFVPTEIDWGIYHEIRKGGLSGCPNLGVTLVRAAKIYKIELDTEKELDAIRQRAKFGFKTR